jgi:N-acetylneuraminic acid mutarotase
MPTPRGNAAAAELKGRIYVIGGYSFGPTNPPLNVVEAYDPQPPPGEWTTVAPLPPELGSGLGALDAARVGKRIYAGGGAGEGPGIENRVWEYDADPFPGTWTKIHPMNVRRALHRMARLKGKLYAIGGVNDSGVLNDVERYDPQRPDDGWETIAQMRERRAVPGVVTIGRQIFVVGGGREGGASRTMEMFDLDDEEWHPLTPLLARPRASLIAALQGVDEILAIGGFEAPVSPEGPISASTRVEALSINQPDLFTAPRPRLIG